MTKCICLVQGCSKPHSSRGFCQGHYRRWRLYGDPLASRPHGPNPAEYVLRFWAKVDKDGPLPECRPDLGRCWVWTARLMPNDYGVFRSQFHTSGLAHRIAYELEVDAIPNGLELDHLCRNRSCVNPAHLEAVTRRENVVRGESPMGKNARKTHCKHGHEFTPANTRPMPSGGRACRACAARAARMARARAYRVRTETTRTE